MFHLYDLIMEVNVKIKNRISTTTTERIPENQPVKASVGIQQVAFSFSRRKEMHGVYRRIVEVGNRAAVIVMVEIT